MHEDIKLAGALLDGNTRVKRILRNRFRDEIELALEHCRVAVELGLEFDEYAAGVLSSAARSLLASCPAARPDATLDPHVTRILGHRDFALALLLGRRHEDAWRVFVQRFGSYIRSLYIRDGLSYDEAQSRLEILVRELAGGEDGAAPITAYRGSVDLNNWLYCHVRACEGGQGLSGNPRTSTVEKSYVLPLVLHEDELRQHVHDEFALLWKRLSPTDQRLLHSWAVGVLADPGERDIGDSASGTSWYQLFVRHRDLIASLSQELRKRVVAHYRGLVSAAVVEEAIMNVVTAELAEKLVPVVGAWDEQEEARP